MPEMKSPNFVRNVPANQQRPLREYNVGVDETVINEEDVPTTNPFYVPPGSSQQNAPDPAQVEARIQQARKEKEDVIKYGPRISEFGKRRIELLSNIGRLTKDVDVGTNVFSLRTLKTVEMREATLASMQEAKMDMEVHFSARNQQLARALYKIDGEDVSVVLGSNDLEVRLALIDSMENSLVERLWDALTVLKTEAANQYGIKNAKGAEEVAADLKK